MPRNDIIYVSTTELMTLREIVDKYLAIAGGFAFGSGMGGSAASAVAALLAERRDSR